MAGGGVGIGARTLAAARRVTAAGRRVPAAGFRGFRAVVFLVVAFLVVVFFVVDFFAVAFFVVTFLVVAFLVLAFSAVFFFVGRAVLVLAAADVRERVFGFVRTREVEREREGEAFFAGAFFFGDAERDILIGIVPPFRYLEVCPSMWALEPVQEWPDARRMEVMRAERTGSYVSTQDRRTTQQMVIHGQAPRGSAVRSAGTPGRGPLRKSPSVGRYDCPGFVQPSALATLRRGLWRRPA